MADARNTGPPEGGQALSLNLNPGKPEMTASLIVHDRSRSMAKAPECSLSKSKKEYSLAGPMTDWDPLYVLLIVLSTVGCTLAFLGFLIPFSFYVVEGSKKTRFSLLDSRTCSSFSKGKLDNSDDELKRKICFGSDNHIGHWVLVTQVFGGVGACLYALVLFLQLVNLCVIPRNPKLHSLCLYALVFAGMCFLIAGHIFHYYAVWEQEQKLSPDSYVQVDSLGSGFFLVCIILVAWGCIMTHVSSHSAGPLSLTTRFLHTLKEAPVAEMPPQMLGEAQPSWTIETAAPTAVIEMEKRRESQMSTSV